MFGLLEAALTGPRLRLPAPGRVEDDAEGGVAVFGGGCDLRVDGGPVGPRPPRPSSIGGKVKKIVQNGLEMGFD